MTIDNNKLIEWANQNIEQAQKNKDKVGLGHQYWEYHEGIQSIMESLIAVIKTGKFNT